MQIRRSFILLLTILACPALSYSQAPAKSKSVTLMVTENSGSSTTTERWRNFHGTSSRTKSVTREISIMVRNMSAAPGEFELEWYFVGKTSTGQKRLVYDKGSRPVILKPGAFEKFEVESKELSNLRYRSGISGYSYQAGDKPDGWIIRAKVGDEVVRVKASSPQLEQLEKDPLQFEKFVQEMRD